MSRLDRRLVAGMVGALGVALLALGIALSAAPVLAPYDLGAYTDAWGRVLAGGSPYDPATLAGPVSPTAAGSYRYLPPLGLLLAPLGLLPAPLVAVTWLLGSAALFGALVALALRPLALRPVEVLLAAGALSWSSPVLFGLLNGNAALPLAALYLAPLLLPARPGLAGALLAGAALVRIDTGLLLLASVVRLPRLLAGAIAGGLTIIAVSLLVPGGLAAWIAAPTALANVAAGLVPAPNNASLTVPLLIAGLPPLVVLGAAGSLALGISALAFRRLPLYAAIAVAATLGVAVLPTAWPQAIGSLLPLLLYALVRSGAGARETGGAIAIGVAASSVALLTTHFIALWIPIALLLVRIVRGRPLGRLEERHVAALRRGLVIGGVVGLVAVVAVLLAGPVNNFEAYRGAALRLLAGTPLYGADQLTAPFGAQVPDAFLYAPLFAQLMVPLALLPDGIAGVTYAGLLIAAAVGSALLVVWAAGGGRAALVAAAAFALCWGPVLTDLRMRNIGSLAALAVAVALLLAARRRRLAGFLVLLLLALVKPVFAPLAAVLLAARLAERRRPSRAELVAVALTSAGLAASIALSPADWAAYPTMLLNLAAGSGTVVIEPASANMSLFPWLAGATGAAPLPAWSLVAGRALGLVLAGTAALWAFRRPAAIEPPLVVALLAGVSLSVAAWEHFLAPLLPLAALAIARGPRPALLVGAAGLVFLIWEPGAPGAYLAAGLVALALLLRETTAARESHVRRVGRYSITNSISVTPYRASRLPITSPTENQSR